MDQNYNWQRFWCLREKKIDLSDRGYLTDPEDEYGKYYNPDLKTLENLNQTPCLILLGEPGIGKSTSIETEESIINSQIKLPNDKVIRINLNQFSSEDRLIKKTFENKTFKEWVDGSHTLCLFLDSLDECLLRINTVANLLAEQLNNYPIDRLYLRIACRTFDWPISLESKLAEIFGKESLKIVELVPLRRNDVILALEDNKIEEIESLLIEIEHKDLVPLAIKPLTLNFLINAIKKNGHLPISQKELYIDGCELLCEEINQERRDAKLVGNYSAKQKMLIAGRIAVCTVLSNKYAIWTGPDVGNVPEEDILVSDLVYGAETSLEQIFEVSEEAVRETLSTGLFSSRGSSRMSWAHKTYAEFLAAWYINEKNISLDQILSLIVHPLDQEKSIIPQLQHTSAWISNFNDEVLSVITGNDPGVLLRSNSEITDPKTKKSLIENILKLTIQNKFIIEDYRQLSKLEHPGVADQLKSYISDANNNLGSKRLAIKIAQECKIKELQNDILSITLDNQENQAIRKRAAYYIVKIADEDVKTKLISLISHDRSEDPDDELRGCAFNALWPNHLSTKKMLDLLSSPQKENFFGSYKSFICETIPGKLPVKDLPVLLEWCKKQIFPRNNAIDSFERLIESIVVKSFENIESSEVLEAFADLLVSKIKDISYIMHILKDKVENDINKRQLLIETLMPYIARNSLDPNKLVYRINLINFNEDLQWLINLMITTSSSEVRLGIKDIINCLPYYSLKNKDYEILYEINKNDDNLKGQFDSLFKATKINSDKAKSRKKYYYMEKELDKEDEAKNKPPDFI